MTNLYIALTLVVLINIILVVVSLNYYDNKAARVTFYVLIALLVLAAIINVIVSFR